MKKFLVELWDTIFGAVFAESIARQIADYIEQFSPEIQELIHADMGNAELRLKQKMEALEQKIKRRKMGLNDQRI